MLNNIKIDGEKVENSLLSKIKQYVFVPFALTMLYIIGVFVCSNYNNCNVYTTGL